jgi:hypothetical protein
MRLLSFFVCAALLGACSEREFSVSNSIPDAARDATITGRACDPRTSQWLEGALVYTHLFDEQGTIYDTLIATTDEEGRWTLEVAGGRTYTVYVQAGNDVIQQLEVEVDGGAELTLEEGTCFEGIQAQIAIVTGDWDDLATIFPEVGVSDWTIVNGQSGSLELLDFLTDPAALVEYDAVFLDGGLQEYGVFYGDVDDPNVLAVQETLRSSARGGGILFASDWSYDVAERLWPDRMDFLGDDTVADDAQKGEPGLIPADVLDLQMAKIAGVAQVDIQYDLPVWPVIESVADDVMVHMVGHAKYRTGFDVQSLEDSPLLVSFEEGNGRVVFSTYRIAVNDDPTLRAALRVLLDDIL